MAGNSNSGRRQQPEALARLKGTLQPPCRRKTGSSLTSGKKISYKMQCASVAGYDSLTERAKKIYLSACGQAMALRLLEPADLPQLLVYAKEFDNYLDCEEDLRENGRYKMKLDEEGNLTGYIANPSYSQKKVSWDIVKQISQNFGFSPYDRQRLKSEVDPEDPTTKIVNIIMSGGDHGPEDQ